MFKFLSRGKKHQETTDTDNQLKELMKEVEDKLSNPILKLSRAEQSRAQRGQAFLKDGGAQADVLARLSSKELSRDPQQEGAYVLALAKFNETLKETYQEENQMLTDIMEKFVNPSNNFYRNDLVEQTRVYRKQYEKALSDYNEVLGKCDAINSSKKMDIIKQYATEKERVRLKKIYEQSVYELRAHLEDLKERVNFDFLDMLVESVEAQKKAYGLIYGQLDDIKSYLDDLSSWCTEERQLFAQYQQERAAAHTQLHREEQFNEIRQLLTELDRDTIENVRRVALTSPIQPVDVEQPITDLFNRYGNVPEPSPDTPNAQLPADLSPPSLDLVREAIKSNFAAIGSDLILKSKLDKLISLGEATAQIEKPPANQHPPLPQSHSQSQLVLQPQPQ